MHVTPFLFDDDDDLASKAFMDMIKNSRGKFPKVDENDLANSNNSKDKTNVKPKQITKQKFLGLEPYLKNNIIGQEHAVSALINALRRSQAGLHDPDRPLGVFLFAGSSGVGKTIWV